MYLNDTKKQVEEDSSESAEAEIEEISIIFLLALIILAFNHVYFTVLGLTNAPYGGFFFWVETMIFIGFCISFLRKRKVHNAN